MRRLARPLVFSNFVSTLDGRGIAASERSRGRRRHQRFSAHALNRAAGQERLLGNPQSPAGSVNGQNGAEGLLQVKASRTIPAGMQAVSQKTPLAGCGGHHGENSLPAPLAWQAAEWPDYRPDASVLLPEGIKVMSLVSRTQRCRQAWGPAFNNSMIAHLHAVWGPLQSASCADPSDLSGKPAPQGEGPSP